MSQSFDAARAARVYNRTYLRWVRIHAAEGLALSDGVLITAHRLALHHVGVVSKQAAKADTGAIRKCVKCSGTGLFITGVVNGQPVGKGKCFRCDGKGMQTRRDQNRNWGYDNFYATVA